MFRPATCVLQELAALAKLQLQHQHEQLQKQLKRMLETQHLINTTEQTVAQLRGNMAAFQNNPQAQATAAAALQQAQSHLEPARQLVSKLQASLQEHGVQWDASTGLITHIHNEPLVVASKSRRGGGGSSSSSGKPAVSDRQQPARASSSSSSSSQLQPGPDVVRSSRAINTAQQPQQDAAGASGVVVSSRRRGASAEGAAGGGVRSSPGGTATTWTPVSSSSSSSSQDEVVPLPLNGYLNGTKSVNGAHYVPVQRSSQDEEDE